MNEVPEATMMRAGFYQDTNMKDDRGFADGAEGRE